MVEAGTVDAETRPNGRSLALWHTLLKLLIAGSRHFSRQRRVWITIYGLILFLELFFEEEELLSLGKVGKLPSVKVWSAFRFADRSIAGVRHGTIRAETLSSDPSQSLLSCMLLDLHLLQDQHLQSHSIMIFCLFTFVNR